MSQAMPFQPGDLVVVVLQAPRERIWGSLLGLDGAGIRLQGLTIEQPSLDDVFLRVTGESLEHEVDEAAEDVPAAAEVTS